MSKLPDKEDLLDWIRVHPDSVGTREIARAFGLTAADRPHLKRLLRELREEGRVERRRPGPANELPPVAVLRVASVDSDGDLFAVPESREAEGDAPAILLIPKDADPALEPGDRVLAKLRPTRGADHAYEARPIRKLPSSQPRALGIFRRTAEGGRLEPVERRGGRDWFIPPGETAGARDGDLVELEALDRRRPGSTRGRVIKRHGDPSAPRQTSLIAMVRNEIPAIFPDDALEAASEARPIAALGKREDLRDLPLITIDPTEARDHDDAVCALPDDDPSNEGGHVVWVAIADVAHYVRPGSALDREARLRGNSTYFPDGVSPMLPNALSADLCSLTDGEDRPCIAVRMVLDRSGRKVGHRFARGLMRSRASLSYDAAQAAADGADDLPDEIAGKIVKPLFAAWRTAAIAEDARAPLDLDLPERRIELDQDGAVVSVGFRERLDAHRLIENFMVLANVCAAETLETLRTPLLHRVHEEPNPEKLDALRETVETLGLTLAKGQVLRTRHLNRLLEAARGQPFDEMVQMSVLRSQTQAYYASRNFGHFGLNLPRYAHFTSPIRRYADLTVHRSLIRALKLGDDGLTLDEIERLDQTAEHVSQAERRSMEAERDTADRYLAAHLADRVGGEFEGRVAGVSRAGLFVRLAETGADGLVPISSLGAEYYRHDRDAQTLTGERTGRRLGLGMSVTIRLREVAPMSGGLILELLSADGAGIAAPRRGKRGTTGHRKLGAERIKRAKMVRKQRRR